MAGESTARGPHSRVETLLPGEVDPLGPVFVSYRQSDGTQLAHRLAWTLRTFGLPVWQDKTDLLPGDTRRRLREALDSGLSGAVLIVTPELHKSRVIRRVEAPHLLDLHHRSDQFTFAIANTVTRPPGGLDYTAADRLLWPIRSRLPRILRRTRLADLLHYKLGDDADVVHLVEKLARRRMEALARLGGDHLDISLQTRRQGIAHVRPAGLAVRTRPPDPDRRLPPAEMWEPFAQLLASLPLLIDTAGVGHVQVCGGAHLSIAYALGAAVPTTSGLRLTVRDADGGAWALPTHTQAHLHANTSPMGGHERLAVLVDIADTPQPTDTFTQHVGQTPNGFAGALTLRHIGRVDAQEGTALVRAAADQIRATAAAFGTTDIALFLRVPFPFAVLLGQALNTLLVTVHEWDDTEDPPAYRPTLTLASGRGGGPVAAIHQPEPSHA